MKDTSKMTTVQQFIKDSGGYGKAALALGKTKATVQTWNSSKKKLFVVMVDGSMKVIEIK